MNKLAILITFFIISCLLLACGTCHDCDSKLYKTTATIYLVNETSFKISSAPSYNFVIEPGQTYKFIETYEKEYNSKPTIDTYEPFSKAYVFTYIDISKCEVGTTEIENYENRKEISPLKFEFTFRFTEAKKAEATPCNL